MKTLVDISGVVLTPYLYIYYAREYLDRAELRFARIETVNPEKNKIGVRWSKNGRIITVGDVDRKVVVPYNLSEDQIKEWANVDSN